MDNVQDMNLDQMRYFLRYMYICVGICISGFSLELVRYLCSYELSGSRMKFRRHHRSHYSNIASIILLVCSLILIVVVYYKDKKEKLRFEPKITIAISGHVLAKSGQNFLYGYRLESFMDYIMGINLNEDSHFNCFIETFGDMYHSDSFLLYKNAEGIIKAELGTIVKGY